MMNPTASHASQTQSESRTTATGTASTSSTTTTSAGDTASTSSTTTTTTTTSAGDTASTSSTTTTSAGELPTSSNQVDITTHDSLEEMVQDEDSNTESGPTKRWERPCPFDDCTGHNHNSKLNCDLCKRRIKKIKVLKKEDFESKQASSKMKDLLEKRANQLHVNHSHQILVLDYSINPHYNVVSHYATPGPALRFWEKVGGDIQLMWKSFMDSEAERLKEAEEQAQANSVQLTEN